MFDGRKVLIMSYLVNSPCQQSTIRFYIPKTIRYPTSEEDKERLKWQVQQTASDDGLNQRPYKTALKGDCTFRDQHTQSHVVISWRLIGYVISVVLVQTVRGGISSMHVSLLIVGSIRRFVVHSSRRFRR